MDDELLEDELWDDEAGEEPATEHERAFDNLMSGEFELLYREHRGRVIRYVTAMAHRWFGAWIRTRHLSEAALKDVVASASNAGFADVFANPSPFDYRQGSFATFVAWRSAPYLKAEVKGLRLPKLVHLLADDEQVADSADQTIEDIDRQNRLLQLRRALGQIPDADQEILFHVYFVHDARYGAVRDAAKTLGISTRAADSRLRRALARLSEQFGTELAHSLKGAGHA